MDSSAVWIIVAVIAVLIVLGLLVFAARRRRQTKLHGEAQSIREQVKEESVQVNRREALADETAAKARAAKAEAEVKAAEAARLEQRAGSHRSAVETSRSELDSRREHADTIDPKVKVDRSDGQTSEPAVEQPR
jgi:hypothetical protein